MSQMKIASSSCTMASSWIILSLLLVWNGQLAHGFIAATSSYHPLSLFTSTTGTLQSGRFIVHQKQHRRLPATIATSSFHRKTATTTTGIGAAAKAATSTVAVAAPSVAQSIIRSTKIPKKSIVKGKFFTVLSKFLISPRRYFEILKAVFVHLTDSWNDLADVTLILVCLKVPVPLARYIFGKRPRKAKLNPEIREALFLRSKTRKIAEAVHDFGFLYTFLYFTEIVLFILDELKFKFVHKYPVHSWTAGIVISIWTAKFISEFKYYSLTKGGTIDITKKSEIRLLNRIADVFIYAGTAFAILDFLSVEVGFALKSIFGLSSFATLVFSLASKELAQEFLASLAIQGTNMYAEGEKIMLKDGTVGHVQKLGWLNTHIRLSDELVVRIPNTQISNQRLTNISRTKLSAVLQSIAIESDSIDKVTKLTEDIKSEIRESCPTLVDEIVESRRGSLRRKLRVFWTNYKEQSLEIIVDAKFTTPPKCDDYYELRQQVLLAISRAAKKNGVQFKYIKSDNLGSTLLD